MSMCGGDIASESLPCFLFCFFKLMAASSLFFLLLNKSFITNRAACVMFVFEDETLVSTRLFQSPVA